MKKIVDRFFKPTKSKENFYSVNKSEPLETDRNVQFGTVPPTDIYKSLDFDNYYYLGSSVCPTHGLTTNSGTSLKSCECENAPQLDAPISQNNSSSFSSTSSSQLNSSDADISKVDGSWQSKREFQRCNSNSELMCSDFINSFLIDNAGLKIEQNKEKYLRPKEKRDVMKSGKSNCYVISINNSKHFHIGSQETFNVSDCVIDNLKGLRFTKTEPNIEQIEDVLNELLDSEARLTKDNIILISLHLNGQWKAFGKDLGLSESYLEDLNMKSDGNSSLIIYDALHKYVNQFPNTTLGFIVSVLKKNNEINLIRELAQCIK